jgi:dihydropteroate synthase
MIEEGADILDIGGESTRPDSKRVEINEEIKRTIPVIKAIKKRFEIPVSIDTSKSEVAKAAFESGAEIINDISGLKFDEKIAEVAAKNNTGLVLMHLRGGFETMHSQEPVKNIISEVTDGFELSLKKALGFGVREDQICLDIGIGFSKTQKQNLQLLANLDFICQKFEQFPMLVGTSRKSFIGKILNATNTEQRVFGTIASNVIAIAGGASIIRVHDVRAHFEAVKITEYILKYKIYEPLNE